MAVIRSMVVLDRDTGLPEDRSINTFHWRTAGVDPTTPEINAIAARLILFYRELATGQVNRLTTYMAGVLDGTADIIMYNMDDPQPRVPIYEDFFGLNNLGASSGPEEVALCLSFQGIPESGVSQARRRGRIYLGPLGTGGQTTVSGRVRPSTAFINDLVMASKSLYGDGGVSSGVEWGIRSEATVPALFTPAKQVWVDDAFDTQRRRGPAATTRQNLTL